MQTINSKQTNDTVIQDLCDMRATEYIQEVMQ